ncbi:hypothetical protein [Clostridium estertheticum]|nr:hypothetical protein [Clostridium estertheticum]MBU3172929.1 hypothetical protein [Clostridium estertheticum]MBZ9616091.1 hypothetical protein [Clostridium estertheticum subsp. laramiense]WAG71841.1 hypothetical protein LL032_11585 [Clostridium estertheticum]
MKKKTFFLLSIVAIVCISLILYSRIYTITEDRGQLESKIIQFINRPIITVKKIDIKQELNIDNKKYIIFIDNNNTLGNAELTKGLNNKYKIESTGGGNSCFYEEIYKTNKGKYLIMKGKNPDIKISYVKETVDNKEYKISIPSQEFYMAYCAVPNGTQSVYSDPNKIKFYNKNGRDIT